MAGSLHLELICGQLARALVGDERRVGDTGDPEVAEVVVPPAYAGLVGFVARRGAARLLWRGKHVPQLAIWSALVEWRLLDEADDGVGSKR